MVENGDPPSLKGDKKCTNGNRKQRMEIMLRYEGTESVYLRNT